VKSGGLLPVGRINGQLQLHFSSGTVNVPVIGEVKPIIQATPEKIQLSANSSNTVERLVMLRSGDDRAFEILSATLQNSEGTVETKKLTDGKWQVKLAIQPDSLKPDASVIIKTSIESQVVVAVFLSIR
jgi:hypothetical protein